MGRAVEGVMRRYPRAAARLVAHWCREANRRHNVVARLLRRRWARQRCMQVPPFDRAAHEDIVAYRDYHRYATIAMALARIDAEGVPGALAEAGVYQGWASRFIHRLAPRRRYYLFDTFTGFPPGDLEPGVADTRFRDTSLAAVLRNIGDTTNVEPRPGRVPETFAGLEGERFAFVLLDMDLHRPTLSALAFFYPRLSPGGYLMVHDYHNPESDWGCKRAVDEFMTGKPEGMVEIADMWGSVMFRRARS
jgi:O-methyltransferase